MGFLKSSKHNLLASIVVGFIALACTKKASDDAGGNTPAPPLPAPQDTVPSIATAHTWLVDKNATNETVALFYNLKKLSKTHMLFGHQDDTKRGYNWANEQHLTPHPSREKSDVQEVTGVFPAVYGHDLGQIVNFADGNWYDYEKQIARDLIVDAYNRGGVNTLSWHYANPVSKKSFYWSDSPVEVVSHIIPGGDSVEVFKASLKEVAGFAKSLIGADGKAIPVIFRPFHEFDGGWFWWGATHCTPPQYKALYQFMVTYLRDSLGVHNFMYAWSPDKNFNSQSQYLERYPGDAFVDLVGTDNYGDVTPGTATVIASNKLKLVSDYAIANNKIAALTETGLQNLTQQDWYTQTLLKMLQVQKVELAYVLVWANTKEAFWTPYAGQASSADFINFKNNGYVLFGDKTPAMYQLK